MIKYSDNLNNNVSDRTWINYRTEFGVDESFVSSVPGNLNFFFFFFFDGWPAKAEPRDG